MRIHVTGECPTAKALRGYLRKHDFHVTGHHPDWVVHIEEPEGATKPVLDSAGGNPLSRHGALGQDTRGLVNTCEKTSIEQLDNRSRIIDNDMLPVEVERGGAVSAHDHVARFAMKRLHSAKPSVGEGPKRDVLVPEMLEATARVMQDHWVFPGPGPCSGGGK